MGVLEWLGAHLLGPIVSLWRALNARPRPDVRIAHLQPTGGSEGYVDFVAEVQNFGTQPARATAAARIDGPALQCVPVELNLLVNSPPETIRIIVPRPAQGELMKECNNETTLFGGELCLVVAVIGVKQRVTARWSEHIYDPATERGRYDVQRRYWRIGRGEGTEAESPGRADE